MKFVSTTSPSTSATFKEALLRGIATNGGLFVPLSLPTLPKNFFEKLPTLSLHDIGTVVTSLFIEEIPSKNLLEIIQRAWTFPIPLVKLEDDLYLLELFHGPTSAFKDVGARFMAEVLSYFLVREHQDITILVASSGDTGGAVARGFHNAPHIHVYILYPSGKISRLQEQQMTTLGGNIHAIEIDGTFDDCQRLVKQSLADKEIARSRTLTTANSINLGRLLPQIAYYVWGIAQLRSLYSYTDPPVFVVPSGNIGNLTAGVYAQQMGAPIHHFLAATNANEVLPNYLQSGVFNPRPSIQTFSNAMDVGNPSNLSRLQFLFSNDVRKLRDNVTATRISDEETLSEIRSTYERTGTILDPHTAVGVAAARRNPSRAPMIVTATAHAAKFPDVIQQAIGKTAELPQSLQKAMSKEKKSLKISSEFNEWKAFFLHAH
jgi:threonine synthase